MAIYQKVDAGDGNFVFEKVVSGNGGHWVTYLTGELPTSGQELDDLLETVPEGGLLMDNKPGSVPELSITTPDAATTP